MFILDVEKKRFSPHRGSGKIGSEMGLGRGREGCLELIPGRG